MTLTDVLTTRTEVIFRVTGGGGFQYKIDAGVNSSFKWSKMQFWCIIMQQAVWIKIVSAFITYIKWFILRYKLT